MGVDRGEKGNRNWGRIKRGRGWRVRGVEWEGAGEGGSEEREGRGGSLKSGGIRGGETERKRRDRE